MGYIEFFYKKFPGKSNVFQGGKPTVFEENQCCLEAPRGGYMLPQANIAGGGGVIFMESAFAGIVKKSVRGGPLSKFEGG